MEDIYSADFIITKATTGEDGVKRWAATVSEFAVDQQNDEVTPGLIEYSNAKFESGEYPMPALVVSHFDDPRSELRFEPVPAAFRAGVAEQIYVDGDKPKAKGVFEDNELGDALYAKVREEIEKGLPHEERTRISMAWWPVLEGIEKSENRVVHNMGIIRHFAATKVPVIPSTTLEANSMKQKSQDITTKREDAAAIVGTNLADKLSAKYEETLSKAVQRKSGATGDMTLVEKAEDMPNGKKPAGNTKFDMGACIREKLGEQMERKQAIAACLNMARKAGAKVPPPPKKSEVAAELAEKQKAGEGPPNIDIEDCMRGFMRRGMSKAAAKQLCERQARKGNRIRTDMAARGELQKSEVSEEELEELEEKALLDAIAELINDGEIQVVQKAEPTPEMSSDELLDALVDAVSNTPAPEAVAVVEPTVNSAAGESVAQETQSEDVNTTQDVVVSQDLETHVQNLKSALIDPSLDRTEKALLVNHYLEEIGKFSEDMIRKSTPASPVDQAVMIREALEAVVNPMKQKMEAEVGILIDRVNELEAEKREKANLTPRPKQLRHAATQTLVQKAQAEEEPKGALTARQISDRTVFYGNRGEVVY